MVPPGDEPAPGGLYSQGPEPLPGKPLRRNDPADRERDAGCERTGKGGQGRLVRIAEFRLLPAGRLSDGPRYPEDPAG